MPKKEYPKVEKQEKDTINIFIAYSRKDASFLDEFLIHLKPFEINYKIKIWYDGKIQPGEVWEASIKKHLHEADIILLLISADAINSDYFYEKEMPDALKRHQGRHGDRSSFYHSTMRLEAYPFDGVAGTAQGW